LKKFIILLCVCLVQIYAQDTLKSKSVKKIITESEDTVRSNRSGFGLGLWAGAFSGAGISLRTSSEANLPVIQITGFAYVQKNTSDYSAGISLHIPFLKYLDSKYFFYGGVATYSHLTNRAGVGISGEWNYRKRLTTAFAIDLFTWFSDKTIQVPLVSGGFYFYF